MLIHVTDLLVLLNGVLAVLVYLDVYLIVTLVIAVVIHVMMYIVGAIGLLVIMEAAELVMENNV